MKSKLLLLACLLMAACATVEPEPEPEPTRYAMSCGEALDAQLDCYEKYGARCDANGGVQPN